MEHAYFRLLHMLSEHPGWALAVVLFAAMLESVAFIGTFIPGSTAMFIAGALVGTGTLNLGWVLLCAVAGAVAGDAASYWIGARYQGALRQTWPFRTHPAVLKAGEKYFKLHGAKSVATARFLPPLRAIVPVVAGMLGMTPERFYVVNVASALLWAPVHILPGVVFGASIELAGAVSFRLVVLAAIIAAAAWLIFSVIRISVSKARSWTSSSHRRLMAWTDCHPGRTRRTVLRALNPESPAAGLIVTISVCLLVSATVFFSTLNNVAHGDPLVQIDRSADRFLQSFRSTWADDVFAALSTFGSLPTLAALVLLVIVWMAVERRWRTTAYWISAVAFSQLLILAIQIGTQHYPLRALGSGARAFPSNHVAAAVIIYGFLAFLIMRRVGNAARVLVGATTVAIVVAVALAGLYFDRFALSDALGGAALAAIWVFLVALTAVWRHPEKPRARPLMPVAVLVVVGVAVALQLTLGDASPTGESKQRPALVVVTTAQWIDRTWRTFSCYRANMEGNRREPITVQWAADPEQMKARLARRGWSQGTRLSAHSLLALVSPNVTAVALPVLPRLNDGEPSKLEFVRSHKGTDERDVLRFWPTQYAVERPGGAQPAPIWLGSLVHERLRRPSWPFNVLRPTREVEPMINEHDGSPWRDVEVTRGVGCEGVRVTLISSRPE